MNGNHNFIRWTLMAVVFQVTVLQAERGGGAAADEPPADKDADALSVSENVVHALQGAAACYGKRGGFTAQFTHENISRLGTAGKSMTGRIAVSSTGLLEMNYDAPDEKQLVFDGKKIRAYDVAQKQVVERPPADDILFSSFYMLLGKGVNELSEQFYLRELSPSGASLQVVSLEPKFDTSSAAQIVVTIGECPLVRRIIVVDRAGNMIRLTFFEIQIVAAFPKSAFRLRVPENVTVVRP